MMTLLTEFGVQSRIEDDDHLQGLAAIRKAWRLLKDRSSRLLEGGRVQGAWSWSSSEMLILTSMKSPTRWACTKSASAARIVLRNFTKSSWLLYEPGDILDFKRARGGSSQSHDVGILRHAAF